MPTLITLHYYLRNLDLNLIFTEKIHTGSTMTNIDKPILEFTDPIPAITLKSDRVEAKKRYFIPGISDCEGIINLEDNDVESLISTSNKVILTSCNCSGKNAPDQAASTTEFSLRLNDCNLANYNAVIINIVCGDQYGLLEIHRTYEHLSGCFHKKADLHYGLVNKNEMVGEYHVVVLAGIQT